MTKQPLLLTTLFLYLGLTAQAQAITATNFLNPDAPVARESFAAIDGQNFADAQLVEPFDPSTTRGGVTVKVSGVPQRIRRERIDGFSRVGSRARIQLHAHQSRRGHDPVRFTGCSRTETQNIQERNKK